MYPASKNKFYFLPFMVDTDFWKNKNENYSEYRDGILFVGNDSNRDFKKVVELAKYFKDINLTCVTKQFQEDEVKLPNFKLIRGSWGNQMISDRELKKLYLNSKMVILPIKETYQPSGQSVTLQSLSSGTPVIISQFKGFWDKNNFIDEENILFVKDNLLDSWIEKIENNYFDNEKLIKIGKSGNKLVNSEYRIIDFAKKLEKILSI